jgi:hypothetical protein
MDHFAYLKSSKPSCVQLALARRIGACRANPKGARSPRCALAVPRKYAQLGLRALFPVLVDKKNCLCFVLFMQNKGWHNRGYIPHFDAGGVVQHVVLTAARALSPEFFASLSHLEDAQKRGHIDKALDAITSGDVFKEPMCAAALERALIFFDRKR